MTDTCTFISNSRPSLLDVMPLSDANVPQPKPHALYSPPLIFREEPSGGHPLKQHCRPNDYEAKQGE